MRERLFCSETRTYTGEIDRYICACNGELYISAIPLPRRRRLLYERIDFATIVCYDYFSFFFARKLKDILRRGRRCCTDILLDILYIKIDELKRKKKVNDDERASR